MTIRNTRDMPDGWHLLGMLDEGGAPAYIEKTEAQGQHELVYSDQIPTDISGIGRDEMQEFGFRFGPTSEGDPLFQQVTMPDGWSKRATEHSMWSEIVDADGRVRATIFYKAAHYDRRAFLRWGNG